MVVVVVVPGRQRCDLAGTGIDRGRIDRRKRLQRLLALALLIVLIVTTFTATGLLIHQLIVGEGTM